MTILRAHVHSRHIVYFRYPCVLPCIHCFVNLFVLLILSYDMVINMAFCCVRKRHTHRATHVLKTNVGWILTVSAHPGIYMYFTVTSQLSNYRLMYQYCLKGFSQYVWEYKIFIVDSHHSIDIIYITQQIYSRIPYRNLKFTTFPWLRGF